MGLQSSIRTCRIYSIFTLVFNLFKIQFDSKDLLMKLSDESGLIESQVKEVLIKLQKHSASKLENNRRFQAEGIANFKLKIVGNYNRNLPVRIGLLRSTFFIFNKFLFIYVK